MKTKIFLLLSLLCGGLLVVIFLHYQNSLFGFIKTEVVPSIKNTVQIKPQQYYGMTVDMSQILPESVHYIKNSKGQDIIDMASSLGMNTLRITNITSTSDKGATPSYTKAQWEEVLGKMQKKNIYAVILIEGNSQDVQFHDITLRDYYLNFVKNYVASGVCKLPNVLMVDIANEPALNPYNLDKLKKAAEIVKSECSTTKITIGSWRTDSGDRNPDGSIVYNWHDPKEVKQLEDIVDVDSVHIYGFDKPKDGPYPDPYTLTTGYLNEIRKYTDKPIFIEEFGAGNGDELTDQNTLGSQQLQKNAYLGVLKAMHDFRNKGVMGATGYLFLPRTDGADSWSIAKDNGDTLLPATAAFKSIY